MRHLLLQQSARVLGLAQRELDVGEAFGDSEDRRLVRALDGGQPGQHMDEEGLGLARTTELDERHGQSGFGGQRQLVLASVLLPAKGDDLFS